MPGRKRPLNELSPAVEKTSKWLPLRRSQLRQPSLGHELIEIRCILASTVPDVVRYAR